MQKCQPQLIPPWLAYFYLSSRSITTFSIYNLLNGNGSHFKKPLYGTTTFVLAEGSGLVLLPFANMHQPLPPRLGWCIFVFIFKFSVQSRPFWSKLSSIQQKRLFHQYSMAFCSTVAEPSLGPLCHIRRQLRWGNVAGALYSPISSCYGLVSHHRPSPCLLTFMN